MKLAPDLRAMLDVTESSKHLITGLPSCSEEEIEQRRFLFDVQDRRRKLRKRSLAQDTGDVWPTDAPKTWGAFTRCIGWSNSRIANHFAEEMAAIRRQEQEKKDAKRN